MIQLESERLLLREFLRSDWAQVHEYAQDPEVVRYMEWGPNTQRDTKSFIDVALACQKDRPRRIYEFAVLLKSEERRLIGACGIRLNEADFKQADIGYCYNKNYWGKGYASEAGAMAVEFAFKTLDLHRLVATCDAQNLASFRIMEKLHMRREGHFIQDKKIKDSYRDTYLYAILQSEWRGIQ